MTIITPISWSSLSIQINSMLIGTNTKSQLQQLNSYCFVLRGYKCTRCKSICGVRDQRHGQQCLDQTVWYHLQVWIWMLKDNHEIGVKIVIGNSRILIGKKTRSQHWQLNSYSFVFGDTIAFVATLHLLKLASFLTSCAIVNPKTKESLFNCSCFDLANLN